MQLSQESEERVSMMVDQFLFETGISQQFEDDLNYWEVSTTPEGENESSHRRINAVASWQQHNFLSADGLRDEDWAAEEIHKQNEINWEDEIGRAHV